MNYRNILPLVSHTQAFSTDYWNDFGYWNDGTFWYEKTPTYTARVTAYAAATGITDYTILDPLNIFDLGLTYYGLDTIMKALYPMVTDKTSQSDMATQMKYNFMNPLDTNAAFRLQWFGGWVYSRTGALPNGVNAYANTNLTPSTVLGVNSASIAYYSITNSAIVNEVAMGVLNGSTGGSGLNLVIRRDTNLNSFRATEIGAANGLINSTSTDARGLTSGSIISATSRKLYKNGILLATNSSNYTWDKSSNNLILGAAYNTSTFLADYFTNKECAFASIGNGLTDFQADIFSTLVNNLQKALNRAVY